MFPVATPTIVHPRSRDDELTATWIGHSTTLVQIGGVNVLTDPVFSQRAFPVQWLGQRRIMEPGISIDALPPIDLVLVSHSHYDHLDRNAVRQLARTHAKAQWIVPLGLGQLIGKWGALNVVELDWWERVSVGPLQVTATPARHFSGRGVTDRNRTLWCGFAIDAPGARAFFAGDTAYHPDFGVVGARCGPFDLVMVPIGAYEPRWMMQAVHANPEDAVQIYQDLIGSNGCSTSPVMLGIHWGTFRLTAEPIDEPPYRTSARWHELGLPEDQLWIPRFGETRSVKLGAAQLTVGEAP